MNSLKRKYKVIVAIVSVLMNSPSAFAQADSISTTTTTTTTNQTPTTQTPSSISTSKPASTAVLQRAEFIRTMKDRPEAHASDAYAVARAALVLHKDKVAIEYFEIAIDKIRTATLPHEQKFVRKVASDYAKILRKTDPAKAKKIMQEFCPKR